MVLTPVAIVRSGNLQSGVVSQFKLASGAVNSGQINTTTTPVSGSYLRYDFTWQIPPGTGAGGLVSGSVQSGNVASGSVQGFFGTARNIVSGTVGVFDFGSGAVVAGSVGSGAVVSGNIASGQLGPNHGSSGYVGAFQVGSGAVLSGNLSSGTVFQFFLASGAVNSGHVASGAVLGSLGGGARGIASGTVGPNDLGSGSVLSGAIASGQVGWSALASGSVNSGDIVSGSVAGFFGPTRGIQSGTVGVFDFGSGAVIAGAIGSGAVVSGNVASGQIGGNAIGSGAVTSGAIGSGSVSQFKLASGSVNSGQINTTGVPSTSTFLRGDFAWTAISGFAVSGIQTLGAVVNTASFVSGGVNTILTSQIISGGVCVSVNLSGALQIAMASLSGTMPALGVVFDNVLSGIQTNVYSLGDFQFTSGMANFSGYLGQPLYVGRSGQIVTVSGSWNSGGLLSGDITQPVGVAYTSAGAVIGIAAGLPLVLGLVTSGQIASGQVGPNALASGVILSQLLTGGDAVGTRTLSGLSASNSGLLYTTTAAGLYRAATYGLITQGGLLNAGTLAIQLNWTDDSQAQSGGAVTGLALVTSGAYGQGTTTMRVLSGTSIFMTVALTSVVGAPVYSAFAGIERVY